MNSRCGVGRLDNHVHERSHAFEDANVPGPGDESIFGQERRLALERLPVHAPDHDTERGLKKLGGKAALEHIRLVGYSELRLSH